MALRLPTSTRSVRRPSQLRSSLTIGFAAVVLVTLPLRLMLALAGIAEWTTSWRTVEIATLVFVAPFEVVDSFTDPLFRNVTAAELLATLVFGFLAVYFLALLTVRRKR